MSKKLVNGAFDQDGQGGQEVQAEVERKLLDLALVEYQSVPSYVERFKDARFRRLVEQLREESEADRRYQGG